MKVGISTRSCGIAPLLPFWAPLCNQVIESLFKLCANQLIWLIKKRSPGEDRDVKPGQFFRHIPVFRQFANEGTKPSFDAVSLNRVSDLAGNGQPDLDRWVIVAPVARLQYKSGRVGAVAFTDSKKRSSAEHALDRQVRPVIKVFFPEFG